MQPSENTRIVPQSGQLMPVLVAGAAGRTEGLVPVFDAAARDLDFGALVAALALRFRALARSFVAPVSAGRSVEPRNRSSSQRKM